MAHAKRIKLQITMLFAAALGFSATIQFYPSFDSTIQSENSQTDYSYFSPQPEILPPRGPAAVVFKSTRHHVSTNQKDLSPIQKQLLQAFNDLDPKQKRWIEHIKGQKDNRTRALLVFLSGIKASEIAKKGVRVFDAFKNSINLADYQEELLEIGNYFNKSETQAFKNSFYEVLNGHIDGEVLKLWLKNDVEKMKQSAFVTANEDIESFIKITSRVDSLTREEKIKMHKEVIASLRSANPEPLQEMSDWFLNN